MPRPTLPGDGLASLAGATSVTAAVEVPLPPEFARTALPEIPTTSIGRCPLCGATDARQFAEGFDYELETCRNRWRFVQCVSCTHVWLDPRPAVE